MHYRGSIAWALVAARPRPLLARSVTASRRRRTLQTVRTTEALRSIPVVMLTSSREQSDLVESYRLGVNSYIVKPVTFEALVDILQTLEKYWFEIVELPTPRES